MKTRPLFAVAALLALAPVAGAASPVAITLDSKSPGPAISEDFIGLSYETSVCLPGPDDRHYFSPDNRALIATFKMLGVRSLRIGGNKADAPTTPIPSHADLDSLFHFAQTANVRVIYTLRLKTFDPNKAMPLAKYIADNYAGTLECFEIGNEPNMYVTTAAKYTEEARAYMRSVTAAVPNAVFCGPSPTPGKRAWAAQFANDLSHSPRIHLITAHAYPGGNSEKAGDPAAARDKILAPTLSKDYETFYGDFAPAALANGFPYRIEEINSYFHGGSRGASDTMAAALWGADCMFWWAQHRCRGLNFHMNPIYGAFVNAPGGYAIRPLGYAMKVFDIAGHGRFVPASIDNKDSINLTTYATLSTDNITFLTLINREHGEKARTASVTLHLDAPFSHAEALTLAAPAGDVSAKTGLTLGEASINNDSEWNGKWLRLNAPQNGELPIQLAPATIAIVRLTR